jgi:hypothetical protein
VLSTARPVNLVNESGIVPVRLFPCSSRVVKTPRLPRAGGIVPVSLFESARKVLRSEMAPYDEGMVPAREFPDTNKKVKAEQDASEEGRVPVKEFETNVRYFRDRAPEHKSDGIVPYRLLELRLTNVRAVKPSVMVPSGVEMPVRAALSCCNLVNLTMSLMSIDIPDVPNYISWPRDDEIAGRLDVPQSESSSFVSAVNFSS